MEKSLFYVPENEALNTARIKYYYNSDGELYPVEYMVCTERVFRNFAFELDVDKVFKNTLDDRQERSAGDVSSVVSDSSLRRSRKALYELIRCNPFTFFVTLTVNGEKLDREDYKSVIRRFGQWADNRVRRKGLIYCGVVERHKKSNGLHLHLVTNGALELVDSGTVKCSGHRKPIKIATADRCGVPADDRKTVYNVSDWGYGYSTAIEITGDSGCGKVAAYLRKYLTKDMEKIGGRLYYSGGDLKRPVYKCVDGEYRDYEDCFDYEFSVGGKAYRVLNLEKRGFVDDEVLP